MSKFHFVRQAVTTAMMGLLMVGCASPSPTPLPEQMDKSPFTGNPCAAPCWYGLVAGKSSENETLSRLSTLAFIDPNSIQMFRESSAPGLDPKDSNYAAQIVANCIYPEKQCLILRTESYTLTEIEVVLNYEITLEGAIGYLGVPDYVGYQDIGLAPVSCEIDIVWYDIQVILSSEIFEGDKAVEMCGAVHETGKANADLIISRVIYSTQMDVSKLLAAGGGEFFEFNGTLP